MWRCRLERSGVTDSFHCFLMFNQENNVHINQQWSMAVALGYFTLLSDSWQVWFLNHLLCQSKTPENHLRNCSVQILTWISGSFVGRDATKLHFTVIKLSVSFHSKGHSISCITMMLMMSTQWGLQLCFFALIISHRVTTTLLDHYRLRFILIQIFTLVHHPVPFQLFTSSCEYSLQWRSKTPNRTKTFMNV